MAVVTLVALGTVLGTAACAGPGAGQSQGAGEGADGGTVAANPTPTPTARVMAREDRAYLGAYADSAIRAEVIDRAGVLVLTGVDGTAHPLVHVNADVFVPEGEGDGGEPAAGSLVEVAFTIGANGRASALTLGFAGDPEPATLGRVE